MREAGGEGRTVGGLCATTAQDGGHRFHIAAVVQRGQQQEGEYAVDIGHRAGRRTCVVLFCLPGGRGDPRGECGQRGVGGGLGSGGGERGVRRMERGVRPDGWLGPQGRHEGGGEGVGVGVGVPGFAGDCSGPTGERSCRVGR